MAEYLPSDSGKPALTRPLRTGLEEVRVQEHGLFTGGTMARIKLTLLETKGTAFTNVKGQARYTWA